MNVLEERLNTVGHTRIGYNCYVLNLWFELFIPRKLKHSYLKNICHFRELSCPLIFNAKFICVNDSQSYVNVNPQGCSMLI